ncbi:MAG TPA: DUF255 domain-containing protein [Campylobacterales bacterium]|nr:DUF255 domain-containing protein [Campylobacterales bacterium]HHC11261.1 DUF255 domain-containing protein [Campylobacterales bacterium]HHD80140.1 DUF255 domain-containing protein [Campylobacterales bacterium]
MKKILILISILSSLLFANSENNTSYKDALKIAKKEHKIIMIELVKEDCHFCERMDKEVMIDDNISSTLSKDFVVVKLDVNRDKLPLGLKKEITPTFAFVKESGEVFSIIRGAWNRDDFKALLRYIKKKSKIKRELKE